MVFAIVNCSNETIHLNLFILISELTLINRTRINTNFYHWNKNFIKLYKAFCPGPITFVLNKRQGSRIAVVGSGTTNISLSLIS